MRSFILTVLLTAFLPGLLGAAVRSGGAYAVPAEAQSLGGGFSANGPYANESSLGLIGGESVAPSPALKVDAGFNSSALTGGIAPEIEISSSSLDFGSVAIGSTASLDLVISNTGTQALTLSRRLEGLHAAQFTTNVLPTTLAAGGQVTLTVTFAPDDTGAHEATLVLTSDDDDERALNIALTGTGTVPPQPVFDVQPLSQVVLLGGAAAFNPVVTGDNPITFQWRKGTAVIKGAMQTSYSIPTTKSSDAGVYTLVADNSVGAPVASQPAYLAVVTPVSGTQVLKKGTTLNLKATVAAPTAPGVGIRYVWKLGTEVLVNGTRLSGAVVSGAEKAALSITKMGLEEAGDYTCVVTLDTPRNDPEVAHGVNTVRVVDAAPEMNPIPLPVTAYVGQVIGEHGEKLTATNFPSGFQASGLPAGLKLDAKTGRITGQPTTASKKDKQGDVIPNKIIFKATNAWGTGQPEENLMTILPLPAVFAGSYTGLVARDDRNGGTGEMGGLVSITVSGTSAVTGKLTLLGKQKPFTTSLRTAVDGLTGKILARVSFSRSTPDSAALVVDMTLTVKAEDRSFAGDLEWAGVAGTGKSTLSGWHNQTAPMVTVPGVFNSALLSQAPEGDADYPQGTGYLTLTVSTAGVATWGGKLSDNSTITGSSNLGPLGQVPLHLPLYTNTGSLQGWSKITDNGVDGTLDWFKAEQPSKSTTRSYKGGFLLHNLTVEGGRYIKLTTGNRAMGLVGDLQAVLKDGGLGGLVSQGMTLTTGNSFNIPSNGINLKLSLNAATGLLTGSFTQPGLTLATPRKANIFGALIPGSGHGVGFFNLPENPDAMGETPANTPMHSGFVEIKAQD